MSQEAPTQRFDLSGWIDRHKILTVIINLVALVLLFSFFHHSSDQNNEQSTPPSPTSVAESQTQAEITPTISQQARLGITREAVITGLHKADPSINFKTSTPVNGIERYMAQEGQNGIELYGNADNLTEVTSTALLGNNSGDYSGNVSALVYVVGVASVVDAESKDWMASTMKEINSVWSNGQNSVKKSTVINGKKFDIDAEKSKVFNTVSLTIYSAQESEPPTSTKADSSNAFPGLDKVKINASLKTNEQGMIFTNNENQDWKFCIDTINPEDGSSDWYEYDFGDMPAHQTYALIPWAQLKREDGTAFDHTTSIPKTIELTCELGEKTIGIADFPGK